MGSQNVSLTIHRGTRQIGGSCVELRVGDSRIVLDAGLPLDSKGLDDPRVPLDVPGLFTHCADGPPVDGLFISHAHQDHYGLIDMVREDVPIYMSTGTKALVDISRTFSRLPPLERDTFEFRWHDQIDAGAFRVVPHLVDHSAFDAFAFEIEAGGKRLFYSGDFRGHGPIEKTLEILRDRVRPGIDAMLMEGTMLGREDEARTTEEDIAAQAAEICGQTDKAVLIYASGQNVSRTISFYKAARRSNRTLVLDVYTAYVMETIAKLELSTKIPHPGHPELIGVDVLSRLSWKWSFQRLGCS